MNCHKCKKEFKEGQLKFRLNREKPLTLYCYKCYDKLNRYHELKERKAIWMAKATALFDTPRIRKEAEEMFERSNKV